MYLAASLVVGATALKSCPNKDKNKIVNSLYLSIDDQKAAESRVRAHANAEKYFRIGDHGFVQPLTDEKQQIAKAKEEERKLQWAQQIQADAQILKQQQERLQELPERTTLKQI